MLLLNTPKIADIWDKFQPGDSVPDEIASSAREVEAITFESTSQLRMGLCLLASTTLCNTTQNIPCHAESSGISNIYRRERHA
ncbi:MAG: hypothetical protein R3A45_06710 [Bdellovibrionota bacterium]